MSSAINAVERNQEATLYITNIDTQVTDDILYDLFLQCGPLANCHIPKDRVSGNHAGYGFVEYRNADDAEYAIGIMNSVKLYGKPLRINKASQDRKTSEVGANLFIGNLDPDIEEKTLQETFSVFGNIVGQVKITRDEQGVSKGFGFINYDNFASSDYAIEAMNGQFLGGKQIAVTYAFRKDSKERHGSEAERLLAANNPNQNDFVSQKKLKQMIIAGVAPMSDYRK
jgi:splicing factor 3B subunit 4